MMKEFWMKMFKCELIVSIHAFVIWFCLANFTTNDWHKYNIFVELAGILSCAIFLSSIPLMIITIILYNVFRLTERE